MTSYTAISSKTFEHELDRLSLADQKMVLRKVAFLEENPRHPSLQSEMLNGQIDLYKSRVNKSIRMIWHYKDNKTIELVDVGHHDILKKY